MDFTSHHPKESWLRRAGVRLCRRWWLKAIIMAFGMTVFFAVYFRVLNHPQFPVTIMPLTAIDRLIGFQPRTLYLYLSLWFYVTLAPALLSDRQEIISYALAAIVLSAIGLGIFFFWPTSVPQPDVDWSRYPEFAFLKSADAPGNACPSLHVAFAVFTAVWLERLLRRLGAGYCARGFNWLWCLGIVYSTVAIHQHVFLDALAGAMLGAMVAALHLRWLGVRPISA